MPPVLTKLAPTKNKAIPRRSWNAYEEHCLMECVKDCILNGWKADNSFKMGYLQYLENKLKERCPTSNLTGDKHISSKLTVWKRTWSKLHDMVNSSGFGWTTSTNTEHVDSDDVWINYVKVHPQVENMRYKNYPLFPGWCDIFGNDRATGAGAMGCEDAEDNMNGDYNVDVSHLQTEDDVTSTSHEPTTTQTDGLPTSKPNVPQAAAAGSTPPMQGNLSGNKRKGKDVNKESNTASIVEAIKTFMEKSDEFLALLASKLESPEQAYSAKTRVTMLAIQEISNLSEAQEIYVTARILNNPSFMEMFQNWDQSRRLTFVQMLVEGKIP